LTFFDQLFPETLNKSKWNEAETVMKLSKKPWFVLIKKDLDFNCNAKKVKLKMNSHHDDDVEQPRLQPQHQQPPSDLDPEDRQIVPKIGDCKVSMVKSRGKIHIS